MKDENEYDLFNILLAWSVVAGLVDVFCAYELGSGFSSDDLPLTLFGAVGLVVSIIISMILWFGFAVALSDLIKSERQKRDHIRKEDEENEKP